MANGIRGARKSVALSLLASPTAEARATITAAFGVPVVDQFASTEGLVGAQRQGKLASNNFQDAAVIDGNYLGTVHDLAAVVRAIEAARELGNQQAFDSVLRQSELVPGPKASAEIRERETLANLAKRSIRADDDEAFRIRSGTAIMTVDVRRSSPRITVVPRTATPRRSLPTCRRSGATRPQTALAAVDRDVMRETIRLPRR